MRNKKLIKYTIIALLIPILAIFILVVILSTIHISVASSSYRTKVHACSRIKIAKPIIELEAMSECTTINENSKNIDYYFKIKNYNEYGEVNNIAQRYMLSISTNNTESIKRINYDLYATNIDKREEKKLNLIDNKSEPITLIANLKKDDYYKLTIKDVESNINFIDSLYINVVSDSMQVTGKE